MGTVEPGFGLRRWKLAFESMLLKNYFFGDQPKF
jgi:hypothetical protein